ncbi:hypothetical protein HK102_000521 [Quaeritorhiza haematococci]|nr:hypothetical protein HK102_000521 [Quaeritorhiza haematococci]
MDLYWDKTGCTGNPTKFFASRYSGTTTCSDIYDTSNECINRTAENENEYDYYFADDMTVQSRMVVCMNQTGVADMMRMRLNGTYAVRRSYEGAVLCEDDNMVEATGYFVDMGRMCRTVDADLGIYNQWYCDGILPFRSECSGKVNDTHCEACDEAVDMTKDLWGEDYSQCWRMEYGFVGENRVHEQYTCMTLGVGSTRTPSGTGTPTSSPTNSNPTSTPAGSNGTSTGSSTSMPTASPFANASLSQTPTPSANATAAAKLVADVGAHHQGILVAILLALLLAIIF